MENTRRCSVCEKEFPATAEYFHRCKALPGGLRVDCKLCRKWQSKEYFSKNRERLLRADKERREREGEEHLAKRRARRAVIARRINESRRLAYRVNPEPARALARAYRAANPEKKSQQDRRWREANLERVKANKRRWRAANLDRHRLSQRIHAAKRRGRQLATGESFTKEELLIRYHSQGGRCWWCGAGLNGTYEADHLVPLARGGGNGIANIVCSCSACNRSKGAKLPSEWRGRLL